MKLYSLIIALSLFFSANVFAQKTIRHKVKPGESIYAIGKKYDVSVNEIYDLNPKLKGATLGLKTVVNVPNKNYKPEEASPKGEVAKQKKSKSEKKQPDASAEVLPAHLVLAKETLYGISKKYNIPIATIEELNPEIKTGGLKTGMVLQLVSGFEEKPFVKPEENAIAEKTTPLKVEKDKEAVIAEVSRTLNVVNEGSVIHKVLPKETLFRISKKYDVSINELQKLNPDVASGLPVGYDLIIKKGTTEKESVTTAETPTAIVEVKPLSLENKSKAEFLIGKASENLGTRYRSGGTTSAGFDCSGLMFSTFKNIDMTLPRSSYEMAQYGVKIDKSQAQKGDLIFFATFGRGRVSHVGMVTEVLDDEIKFIHSSTQAGVIVSSTKENYYSRTFVQINRVLSQ